MAPTFDEHATLARQHPEYWSYLMTLELRGIVRRAQHLRAAYLAASAAGECNLTAATMGKLAFALGMRVTTQIVPLDAAVAHAKSGESGPR